MDNKRKPQKKSSKKTKKKKSGEYQKIMSAVKKLRTLR